MEQRARGRGERRKSGNTYISVREYSCVAAYCSVSVEVPPILPLLSVPPSVLVHVAYTWFPLIRFSSASLGEHFDFLNKLKTQVVAPYKADLATVAAAATITSNGVHGAEGSSVPVTPVPSVLPVIPADAVQIVAKYLQGDEVSE